jgi:hypothetical protein
MPPKKDCDAPDVAPISCVIAGRRRAIQLTSRLFCGACGGEWDAMQCLVATLNDIYYAEAHYPSSDAWATPVQACPECQQDTYVLDDAECAACGFAIPAHARCDICDTPLTPEDLGTGHGSQGTRCAYHQSSVRKDD